MTKEETAELVKVMQAYVDGKPIQVAGENGDWIDLDSLNEQPIWTERLDYRVKPEPTLPPIQVGRRVPCSAKRSWNVYSLPRFLRVCFSAESR